MSRNRIGVLGAVVFALSGCATAYKAGVEKYAGHQLEYVRAITDCQGGQEGYSDRCIRDWAFPASGLPCLVDEDANRSVASTPTRACKCSRASTTEERREACTEWLKSGS